LFSLWEEGLHPWLPIPASIKRFPQGSAPTSSTRCWATLKLRTGRDDAYAKSC
jgi:hypothetical protein